MSVGRVLNNKYRLDEEIGHGGFGKVFRATHLHTKKQYAVKIDLKRKGVAYSEAKILYDLVDGVGIPKLHSKGNCSEFSFFVMELLNSNLQHIIKQLGGTLNLETVVKAGTQIVNRLEFIHTRGYIHRDIKPSQLLMGRIHKILYLVDFGLAKKYLIFKNHVPFQTHCPRAGNATFSSVNNHLGLRQSRRDDLESAGYMLIYMYKGNLPWQSKHKSESVMKWQKVFMKKASISLQDLCQGCPDEIFKFIDYAKNLKFKEKPDYEYLKRLLNSILNQITYAGNLRLLKSRTSHINETKSKSHSPRKRKISRSRSNFTHKTISVGDTVTAEGIIGFPNTPKSFMELMICKSSNNQISSIPDICTHHHARSQEISESSPEVYAKNIITATGSEEKFITPLDITKKLVMNNSSSSVIFVDFSKDTEDSSNTRARFIITPIHINYLDSYKNLEATFSKETNKASDQLFQNRFLLCQDIDTPRQISLPQFKDRTIVLRAKEDH